MIGIVTAIIVVIVIIVAVIMLMGGQDENDGIATSAISSSASTSASASSSTTVASGAPRFNIVQVSSVLSPDKDTSDYGGINLIDGLAETAWNEGSPGDGTGEWLTLSTNTPQHVTSVSIMGGYPKIYKDGSDVYMKNNRPRDITISYDGGSEKFTMQDLRGQFQTFTLAKPVDTKQITITIDSVYKGNNYDDCCIAEVKVS